MVFRGRGATFYLGLSGHFMSEWSPGYPYRHEQWRDTVKKILQDVTTQLEPERKPIKVLHLAYVRDGCEPDFWAPKDD